jgi:hypothetical protein
MARKSETAAGIAYPQLQRDQINALLDSGLTTMRDRALTADQAADLESALEYLTAFYTRRWGLPPAIVRRAQIAGGIR